MNSLELNRLQVGSFDLWEISNQLLGNIFTPNSERAWTKSDYKQLQRQWSPLIQKDIQLIERLIHRMTMNADLLIAKSDEQMYEAAMQNIQSIYVTYSVINDSLLRDFREWVSSLCFLFKPS
ncbi:hypothetical protein ACFCW7_24165 [Paenibacillus glucanolyticus]|uniref:hypothetical protein n=1 Tax=Paenibacillus glucanolyticus TaxID=59843 RepID=UPI001CE219E8|nr:hypothetical protein [Paenibacillus glucanolyticus]